MANEGNGRLLGAMIGMIVAGMTDPSRLARGRTYARQGAVEDLEVLPGSITGDVQGSRPTPYHVTIGVGLADRFDNPTALVPDKRELRISCTCPDSPVLCKHAVAVMVAFSEEVVDDPELLGLLRGKPQRGSAPRAVVGSRMGGAPPAVETPAFDEAALDALRAFLGEPHHYAPTTVTTIAPPTAAWGELWAEMLADALDVLATELPPLPEL